MRQVSYLIVALLVIFSVFASAGQTAAADGCQSTEYYSVTITSTGTPTAQAVSAISPTTDCWTVCFPLEIDSLFFGPMTMSLANLNTSRNHWGALGWPIMFYGTIDHFKRIQADGMDLSGIVYKIVGVNSPEACSLGSPSK